MKLDTAAIRDYIKKLEEAKTSVSAEQRRVVNRITDRHLARVKENTAVGDSPDSPTLRSRWDRSGVQMRSGEAFAEVFNPAAYASHYEYGHRQTPGRIVFIELRAGATKYGIPAREITTGANAGKWGIFLKLKKSYVKGAFVMTDSEQKAQRELDTAVRRMEHKLGKALG